MDLNELRQQLQRLNASQSVTLREDPDFEPQAGSLLKVTIDEAYWHLPSAELLRLVKDLPDGAGAENIKQAIEAEAVGVWHGPAPEQDRDHPLG